MITTRSFIILIAFLHLTSNLFAINKDSTHTRKTANSSKVFFRENKGQIHNQNYKARTDILYSGSSGGMSFHLKQDGLHYQLSRVDEWKEEKIPGSFNDETIKIPAKTTIHRLDISWPGSNPNSEITANNHINSYDNYYLPSCPDGATNVKSYTKITYKNIYDNIDLVFHNKNDELNYDFLVKPGADISNIKIQFKGAKKIKLNDKGDAIIQTPLGNIIEGKPIVYQKGKQLEANWVVSKNVLSFNIKNYDPKYQLIIDPPVRNWGTYYGGTQNEGIGTTTTDKFGNLFLYGTTRSLMYIATSGSFQTTLLNPPRSSMYMVKFNVNGVRQWSTYYGGSDDDRSARCTSDINGNIYFCGSSGSPDTPTSTNSHQDSLGGSVYDDAFLIKLNQNGGLLWSTYYGGISVDNGEDCATDIYGNVFLTGSTRSHNYNPNAMSTPGSHQPNPGSIIIDTDAFLVKFDSNGTRLWGTYYGGPNIETGNTCSTDSSGNIFIAGGTHSPTSISTSGSFQSTKTGPVDMYIAKFNNSGVIQWGTYYGGVGSEYAESCKTDPSGNLFVAGISVNTPTLMATSGAYQTVNRGQWDIVLAKFDSNGNRIWSTYLGGHHDENSGTCDVNRFGDVIISGTTHSYLDSIHTPNAYQPFHNGGITDALLAKFDNNGNIYWSTYYGGNSQDHGWGCSTSLDGNIYLSGRTMSSSSIASFGSHQPNIGTVPGSIMDNFIVQFCDTLSIPPSQIFGSSNVCINDRQNILYYVSSVGNNFSWTLPAGASFVSGQGTDSIIINLGINGGTIGVSALNGCTSSLQTSKLVNINSSIPPLSTTITSNSICLGDSVTLSATGCNTYIWNTGDTTATITVSPTNTTTYTVIGSTNACDTISPPINIAVNQTYLFSDTISLCQGDSVLLFGQYVQTPGIYKDSLQTVFSCDSIYSTLLVVNPNFSINDTLIICQGDSINLGGSYQNSTGTFYDTLSTVFGCDSIITSYLSVNPTPTTPITKDTSTCFNDGIPLLFPNSPITGELHWYTNSNGTGLIHSGINYQPIINKEGLFTYFIQESINGCKGGISSITLQVYKPTAIINPSEVNGMAPLEILFGNGSTNANSYLWYFGTGDSSNLFSPNYTYDSKGDFIVTLIATDLNECIDSTTITIEIDIEYIVSIPNTITPNNDGANDFWIIENLEHFPNHSIQVFNRNGSSVFHTKDYQNDWNGQYNGNDLPATSYYYVVDLGNGDEVLKGDLSIIREK